MPLLECSLLTILKTLSFFFDVFTYIPYYLYQDQAEVLAKSKARKVSELYSSLAPFLIVNNYVNCIIMQILPFCDHMIFQWNH